MNFSKWPAFFLIGSIAAFAIGRFTAPDTPTSVPPEVAALRKANDAFRQQVLFIQSIHYDNKYAPLSFPEIKDDHSQIWSDILHILNDQVLTLVWDERKYVPIVNAFVAAGTAGTTVNRITIANNTYYNGNSSEIGTVATGTVIGRLQDHLPYTTTVSAAINNIEQIACVVHHPAGLWQICLIIVNLRPFNVNYVLVILCNVFLLDLRVSFL